MQIKNQPHPHIAVIYTALLLAMAAATVVEKLYGTPFALSHIYGAWWFITLWAVLALSAVIVLFRRGTRRPSTVCLHLAFAVILAGAALTHFTSTQDSIHLRLHQESSIAGVNIRLDSFNNTCHHGTSTAADYVSRFTVSDGSGSVQGQVSMNNVFVHHHTRFYQHAYDADHQGSTLLVNADPYGLPVTYTGYGLLAVALLWMLLDAKGTFRRLCRHPMLRRGLLCITLLTPLTVTAHSLPTLPAATAHRWGQLYVLHNGRICQLQTMAMDFTKKLYGDTHYHEYSAEQVLAGFVFHGDRWSTVPIIKMKRGGLRSRLQLPAYCSVNTFFVPEMGGYILGPYLQEWHRGANDEFHRHVADIDDRLQMVMDLRRGILLKVFPYTESGNTRWYAPTDDFSHLRADSSHIAYMQHVFQLMHERLQTHNIASTDSILHKMMCYQQQHGGSSLPSALRTKAERIYNALPLLPWLFIFNLVCGILLLAATMGRMCGINIFGGNPPSCHVQWAAVFTMSVNAAMLTVALALRWVIGGHIPMSNGFETMLTVSWFIAMFSLLLCRRFPVVQPFGHTMSGLFLLVAHLSNSDPQITPLMPVLSSPLLSLHVSFVMIGYALLSFTFICALTALAASVFRGRWADTSAVRLQSLRLLSLLFLYPALAALSLGIFIGALWANVSWGNYWNWDAKEVWALITLMVYAVPVHGSLLRPLRRPVVYHLYMAMSFLCVLMTYFGVNHFLGGMHTYQ